MSFYWYEQGSRKARKQSAGDLPSKSTGRPLRPNPYTPPVPASAQRKLAIVASQIMNTPVATLLPTSSFEQARDLFRNSRYRHIPIVNAQSVLVGILSDRDVLREAAQLSGSAESWVREIVGEQKSVEEFMTKRVLTSSPNAEIRNIARAMFEERIGSMPVVDDRGKVVGIITRSDILRTLVNNAPLELWI